MRYEIRETINMILKRGMFSFSISAFAGLTINLIIDLIFNSTGDHGFTSMSPEMLELFPTGATAAYVNVLLYGVIGATFSMMTLFFEIDRLGYLLQNILYCICTCIILALVTVFMWHLHRYPKAFFPTIAGYGITYMIIFIVRYRQLKLDIIEINKKLTQ